MSDLLTHWAVFEDCRRLAAQDSYNQPFFNTVLDTRRLHARLGSISRRGSKFVPPLLQGARESWRNQPELDQRQEEKLAYALGGVLHYPTDLILKPLMRSLSDSESIREISAHYDCHVFRKVYLAGEEEPFNNFLLQDNYTSPGQALEDFVGSLFQRALLASHTLSPSRENFEEWLDNLFDLIQPLYIDIGLYARTYDDPRKQELYRVETDFYRDQDPLIILARQIHRGAEVSESDFEVALQCHTNHSAYARCLQMGVLLLRQTSAYWNGDLPSPPNLSQQQVPYVENRS